ncbi:E3 ubiquitin-protein ligase HERC2 (HECT domain and RCC1-like domain-containing protein 2) (HECT-type E3 ubiquitin transferase HERC2) [Durusdinium trenchii]|uniref:E3 ubiquitin-protein ligase HERC2 (HECT domain and RCC1-like domain-containing protein 2) (HECT-type E3 ubiquitin transferase HERC2) n=1 Tax=Durusdinium trenchii TaxID=1381693 RepID=A0ABP0MHN6_9DINO
MRSAARGSGTAALVAVGASAVLAVGLVTQEQRREVALAAPAKGPRGASVFAWGGNAFGQLGTGSTGDKFTPKLVGEDLKLTAEHVAAFGQSSGFVTAEAQVYTFGRSTHGSIGQGDNMENINLPAKVDIGPVAQISLGEFHVAFINTAGALFTAGRNWSGELGRQGDNTRPEKVALDRPVVDVACGRTFTAVVDADGDLFTTGNGKQGCLGHGSVTSLDTFTKVDPSLFGGEKVKQVAAGEEVLLILTENGAVYSCGNDDYGKLGLGNLRERLQTTPRQITSLKGERIAQVVCGDFFCAALSENGTLFTWGMGSEGQLGHNSKTDLHIPTQVHAGSTSFKRIAAGGSHMLAISTTGELFAWGKGRNGQLGVGDNFESVAIYHTNPTPVEFFKGKDVLDIAAGRDHSICLVGA